jgi:uncharacterized membrane protein
MCHSIHAAVAREQISDHDSHIPYQVWLRSSVEMEEPQCRNFRRRVVIREGDDSIVEYQPNKFRKEWQGKVVSELSDEDVLRFVGAMLARKIGQVDSGILQVSLALVAICALLASAFIGLLDTHRLFVLPGLVLALAGFALTSYASGRLYYSHLILRFPRLYVAPRRTGLDYFLLGLPLLFIGLLVTTLRQQDTQRHETELAYLSILGAFALIWGATVAYIVASIVAAAPHTTG